MARDLEVRHCRALIAVNDNGGVGAAARALGVAQSTVSETLLSLERLLGIAVTVRRAGREAILSGAAIDLLPHARALVASAEAALAAAASPGRMKLRLGSVESVSSFLLPAPLGTFRRHWPQTDVRIFVGLCADLKARVDSGELDAALTVEASGTAHAAGRTKLCRAQLALVVSPSHALAGRKLLPEDLRGARYLITECSGDLHALVGAWIGNPDELASAGSIEGVKRGLLVEGAIGILPDYAVLQDLDDGKLVRLFPVEPPPEISVFVAWRDAEVRAPALRSLISELERSLSKAGPVLGGA